MERNFNWNDPLNPEDFIADLDTLSVTFKPLGIVFRPASARSYGIEGRLTVLGPDPDTARIFTCMPDGLNVLHRYCYMATEQYKNVIRALLWLKCDAFHAVDCFFLFPRFPYKLDLENF